MNVVLQFIKWLTVILLLTGVSSCIKEKAPSSSEAVDGDTTKPDQPNTLQKVLIIGIDGCRGDAMRIANAPNIHGLLSHSIYSFEAFTRSPTISGPGWSSMLTGVWANKHGVLDNSFEGDNYVRYPMIFKYIKQHNPQLKTISISSWNPINDNLVSNADVRINANGNDNTTKDSAIARLTGDDPDIMFLHFDDVDHAGHQYAYDTANATYLQAISRVDGYVGEVLSALNKRPQIGNENWLIIVSTDHGGKNNSHGGDSFSEKNIFTIFYNKHFNSREITAPSNPWKTIHFQSEDEFAYSTDTAFNFDKLSQFTVQFQIKSSGLNSDIPFITNKDWNSGGNPGWVICIRGQSWKFNAGDGAGHRIDVNAQAPNLNDNVWHNIAVTVNRSGDVCLYQDNTFYNAVSMAGLSTLDPKVSNKLVFADDITGSYKNINGNASFSLTNIRLWDTLWSRQDIEKYVWCDTTIMQSNPYYKNLMGFWKGTEGSGNIWKDSGPRQSDINLTYPLWEPQDINICNTPIPSSVPAIVDIAPAVFQWLKITVNPAWGFDGKSWIPTFL